MATGKFAKDSNFALGTEEANTKNEDLNANAVSELNANGESEATPSLSNLRGYLISKQAKES